jgi:predicted neuraminidase
MMNVALSSDGINWKPALLLDNEAKAEFSYPAVIQKSDGQVHITYTWKRQRLTHVVVEPADLVLREFKDGQWPLE